MGSLPTLVQTGYVPPGSYIGQLIVPQPGSPPPYARVPCYIGRGSRYALGSNLPLKRSFVYDETLIVSSSAPYLATLQHTANGDQTVATLAKQDGTQVRQDRWSFYNNNTQVLISTDVFDPTATYSLSYQSVDRTVRDPVPVNDLRTITAVGNGVDQPQYKEFQDFYIEYAISTPAIGTSNTNKTGSIDAPAAGVHTGTGTCVLNAGAAYTHNYNRFYTLTCTAASGGAGTHLATLVWKSDVVSPGNNNGYPVPLNAADTSTPTVTLTTINLVEATPSSLTGVVLENGIVLDFGFGASNFALSDTYTFNAYGPGLVEVDARLSNTNLYSSISAVQSVVTLGGFGSVAVGTGSVYTGAYNAHYKLQVTAVAGTGGTRSATFVWAERGERVGVNGTFSFTIGGADVTITAGIKVAIAIAGAAASNFTVGDYFLIDAYAPRTFYEAKDDRTYTLTCTANTQGTAQLVVSGASYTSPIVVTTSTHGLASGQTVVVTGVTGNTAANGSWVVTVLSPTTFSLNNSVGNAAYGGSGTAMRPAKFSGTYLVNTPEGGFGTWSAQADSFSSAVTGHTTGYFTLPSSMSLVVRNAFKYPVTVLDGARVVANDVFTLTITNDLLINWNLQARSTTTFQTTDFLTDVNGSATGVPGTSYVILTNQPLTIDTVTSNAVPISYTNPVGTAIVAFAVTPVASVVVVYDWCSAEPDPGQTYFFTAQYLRPLDLYNVPTLITGIDAGRTFLAPMAVDNHLAIMNEIAWGQNVPAIYVVQVLDSDDDGVLTNSDFKTAILASESPSDVKDTIVLSHYTSWGDQMTSINYCYDPFQRRERDGWFGAPVGTPIGDANTPDSLVYIATNTLQVFGNSPAHGTRRIVAPTQATYGITLPDGTAATVTLDGSFVAGALAALNASFGDPGTDLLKKTLSGFATMQTYGDVNTANNKILGGAGIIYFTNQGGGVFRIEEDITVDTFAPDFKLINNMNQKEYVTARVRTDLDVAVTGIVVPSAQAGVTLIKGFLIKELESLAGTIVARYQDSNQNERPIDPDKDVKVFIDTNDPTLYHFLYSFWTRSPIKRTFGLYACNTNDFGSGVVAQ